MLAKNENVLLDITDVTREGSGVAKLDGYTVFVGGTLPGERVQAHVIKAKPKYAIAKAEKIIRKSGDRVETRCAHFPACGGCALQHVRYERQLAMKANDVVQTLKRIGNVELPEMPEIIGMAEPWHYRNKAQFPVQMQNGKMQSGFYAPKSHRLIPVEHCAIQSEAANRLVTETVLLCNRLGIAAYDEEQKTGVLRHILVREGLEGQTLVCLVVTKESFPGRDALAQGLMEQGVAGVVVNVNAENTNVILGPATAVIAGASVIQAAIGKTKYEISAPSFFQVNPAQTEQLYETVRQFADLQDHETVYDVYCGAGTISLYLAKEKPNCHYIGVEIVPEAIANAKRNRALNGVDEAHAEYLCGKAEEIIPTRIKTTKADCVIIDPPRAGCEESLLKAVSEADPKRIIYVSCDPATLARDLKYLGQDGWRAEKIRLVDMFPQTAHVESVVLLSRA